ncbi:probable phenylalanine--tRNA ligase, mitochondrial [Leptopilina boulardi]|uniref:probable phenylalanine--tRNA ligase, mitochondrial n=1 Tax=Leptopilina boulardi TaxID=63433 RepID=UPI0021F5382F|nr:probable phenylalanine--tRNA ligase, mitochondrial [Leptopilina boulardi]
MRIILSISSLWRSTRQRNFSCLLCSSNNNFSTAPNIENTQNEIEINNQKYMTDNWTNITPRIISKIGQNLHRQEKHPLGHIKRRIKNYFYKTYLNNAGNPLFSIYDNINPIVTIQQNFDSLLVPKEHVSRNKTDCYYINQNLLLRAHTTAHQAELVAMGLNNFLIVGDVYRRDDIDSQHYPVFHQIDGVRICTVDEVFENVKNSRDLKLFEHRGNENSDKQGCHSFDAVKIMEFDLKNCLVGLAQYLFGKDIQYRWVNEYFPFTHPSWELEIFHNGQWMELLGCGIVRQEILQKAGASERMGWAFGLGLERLAMRLYNIPDIRLFWSTDSGFLHQFEVDNENSPVQYKPVSIHPQCYNDISFWLPENETYSSQDFYDIVREIGGDIIEQISLIDNFTHPKTKKTSHCYRIIYRHLERALNQEEVNKIHHQIENTLKDRLQVIIR